MKKMITMIAAVFTVLTAGNVSASVSQDEFARQIFLGEMQASVASEVQAFNLINWKVGEFTDYDMKAMIGSIGTMHKVVASEQGNAIWVKSEITGMMSQTMEMLIDRADGKVLEARQNGQKIEVPDDKPEIIDQEATTVTVPAGTFDVIHITFKSQQIKKGEIWANPRDLPMDGGAKMVIDTGLLPITMELTKFGGK